MAGRDANGKTNEILLPSTIGVKEFMRPGSPDVPRRETPIRGKEIHTMGLPAFTGGIRRREFLLGSTAFCAMGTSSVLSGGTEGKHIVIVPDEASAVTSEPSVRWALSELCRALE